MGYDAGKRIKGRKRFFLVDTRGNLLASCVVADKGRCFIHAKRWVVERSIAWAGTNRRLAKDYERNTTHANAWRYLANIRRLA